MNKKKEKRRTENRERERVSDYYLKEAEIGERTKEHTHKLKYFICLKIWKNNLEESRENGGVGELPTESVCPPPWAKKANRKEEVYLFKELRFFKKRCAAGKFTGFETDLFLRSSF